MRDAYEKAIDKVHSRMTGTENALKTCWTRTNTILGGGLQKGMQYVVAARPGVGKSAYTNILVKSLFDLNPNEKFICLYFNFEMPSYSQVLRNVSSAMKVSVNDLLSAAKPLEEEKFGVLVDYKRILGRYPIFFIDTQVSVNKIYRIIEKFQVENPYHTIINVFDHTRLALSEKGEEEQAMINKMSKMGVYIKNTMGCINILISQLNRNIESTDRAKSFYEPELSDLWMASAIEQDANAIVLLHRPEMYHIPVYHQLPTKNLIAAHWKKNRDGDLGLIPMRHELAYNYIEEIPKDELKQLISK